MTDYKNILSYYERQFEGLEYKQIRKILLSRGFRPKYSSGVAFIHRHLDFVVKFGYLLENRRPRKAAKTVISKKICSFGYLPLMIQEKVDCRRKIQREAIYDLKGERDWEDEKSLNCGVDKRGKAVIIDW